MRFYSIPTEEGGNDSIAVLVLYVIVAVLSALYDLALIVATIFLLQDFWVIEFAAFCGVVFIICCVVALASHLCGILTAVSNQKFDPALTTFVKIAYLIQVMITSLLMAGCIYLYMTTTNYKDKAVIELVLTIIGVGTGLLFVESAIYTFCLPPKGIAPISSLPYPLYYPVNQIPRDSLHPL